MKHQIIEALKKLYFPKNCGEADPNYKIGMELEFPIASLDGSVPDSSITKTILTVLGEQNGWEPIRKDKNGNYVKVKDKEGSIVSYEACYGIIEFSSTPQKDIASLEKQVCHLFYLVQNFLSEKRLQMIPTGLNPFPWSRELTPLETPYIQMINAISRKYGPRKSSKIAYFNYITCASQLHLDVNYDNAAKVINFFNAITWVKALLFANSFDVHELEGKCLCMRDVYYRENALGYNVHNVGPDSKWFCSTEDFLHYQINKSIFYVMRSGEYIFFRPVKLKVFFEKEKATGYSVSEEGKLEARSFYPELSDISYFRAYNHAAITKRGTVEIRSECQQPFPDVMTSAAFHIGLMFNFEKAQNLVFQYREEISNSNKVRYSAIYLGYSIQTTMKMDVRDFIEKLLCIAREGLILRGLQEEIYLNALFLRLEKQTNPALELKAALKEGKDLVTYFNDKTQEPLGLQGYYAACHHRN